MRPDRELIAERPGPIGRRLVRLREAAGPGAVRPIRQTGSVVEVVGLTVRAGDLAVPVGSLCSIGGPEAGGQGSGFGLRGSGLGEFAIRHPPSGLVQHQSAGAVAGREKGSGTLPSRSPAPFPGSVEPRPPSAIGGAGGLAEVIGFDGSTAILMPLASLEGVRPGDRVRCVSENRTVGVGRDLLGRVIDAMGRPLDGRGPICAEAWYPLLGTPPDPLRRRRITRPIATGVRSIDGLVTCGKGQRMGIFSGTGVGKSVLLGMVARNTAADVTVVGLVGERGREVRDFLERDLTAAGLARSVVVVSTSYEPAPLRVRAGFLAAAIAEYFRDLGMDVMLLMDSVTRLAMAQREVGLSAGEPPATRGYPPSAFALLPRLLERSGCAEKGTVTGFYNVLVEGDDIDEPVSDAARGVLDGHVWLDRRLAARQQYPAVSVLDSVSRLMAEVADADHQRAAGRIRTLLAAFREAEDLISIGAYVRGSTPEVDVAIEMRPKIEAFLRQRVDERVDFEGTRKALLALAAEAERVARKPAVVSRQPVSAASPPGRSNTRSPAARG